jgi:hypothetical protein
MRNFLRTTALLAVLSVPAAAQGRISSRTMAAAPTDREGYSLSLGLGGASAGVSCSTCGSSDRQNGASGYLRVGKGFSQALMMGLELNGWNKTENNATARNTMFSAVAQWYPSATNGFFAKVGAGMGRMSVEDKSVTPTDKLQSTGFGYQFGLGYDIGIASRWSITPYANYLSTAGAKAQFNGTSTGEKMDGNYMQYGLGLSWH